MDTVSFETEPAGAEVKVSNGQTCKTPCALALPTDQVLNVTMSLAGYEPDAETLAPVVSTGEPPRLRPNPVSAELTPAAAKPGPKGRGTKKPAAKKSATKKPVAATKPAPKAAAAPAAAAPAPAPTFAPAPAASSPWPAPAPQR
jgi:hypothetical protein